MRRSLICKVPTFNPMTSLRTLISSMQEMMLKVNNKKEIEQRVVEISLTAGLLSYKWEHKGTVSNKEKKESK